MANKGNSRHMTSLAAPKFYGLHRKEHMYVAKANAGRHSKGKSVPLLLALKALELARSKNEAAKIIKAGGVLVNRRQVREIKYPVGFNDIIEFKAVGKSYKIGIDTHTRAAFEELKKPEYDAQLFKVVGKFKARKGVVRIRLHDGSEAKANKTVMVNDSVTMNAKGEIKDVHPLKVGAHCTVIDGVHTGATGKIKEVKKGSINVVASALIEEKGGKSFETVIENIIVTG